MSEHEKHSSPFDPHDGPLMKTVNLGSTVPHTPEAVLWLSDDPSLREVASNVSKDRHERIIEAAHNTIELVRRNDIINHLEKDPLTGLETRAVFERDFKAYLGRNEPGTALVYIDLLGLNRVNDDKEIGGHDKGDDYLVLMVDAIVGASRPGDRTYRISGDELAVILVGLTPDENGNFDKSIEAAIKNRKENAGKLLDSSSLPSAELYLGLSAGGVALDPMDKQQDSKRLKKQADLQMFKDKQDFYGSLPPEVQQSLKKAVTQKR